MTQASVFCFLWIAMKSRRETKAEIDARPHSCTRPPRKRPGRRSHPARPPVFWAHTFGTERGTLAHGARERVAKMVGKSISAENHWDCFIWKSSVFSTPPISLENIFALIISIKKYKDKLGKCQHAIESIETMPLCFRKCVFFFF